MSNFSATAPMVLPYNGAPSSERQHSRSTPFRSYPAPPASTQPALSGAAASSAADYQPTFPHFKHRHQPVLTATITHLPSLAPRDRPASATTAARPHSAAYPPPATPPPDASPRSSDASTASSQPRALNPLKFAKGERQAGDKGGNGEPELDLWYMTPPGEDRYWMYVQDGMEMRLLRQRLLQTFARRPPRPRTPIAPPAASFPPPSSERIRARLNLLKWLSSPGCLLFHECEEVVSVDDEQLDGVLVVSGSLDDGGARAVQVLMRWSKEGRRYAGWQDVQAELAQYMAAQAAGVDGVRERAMKIVDEEKQRQDKFQQRLERERQDRFTALRHKQQADRTLRQQRKALKDQQRHTAATTATQHRHDTNQPATPASHHRTASAASTASAKSLAGGAGPGGGRRAGEGVAGLVAGEVEERKEREDVMQQGAGGTDEQADEAYDDDGDDKETVPEVDSANATNAEPGRNAGDSLGGESERSTHADKEAQEEKQALGMLALDASPSDDEDDSHQPALAAVSSTRPSSRVPPLLTPSPRAVQSRGGEVGTDRASARKKQSARADNVSGESTMASEQASDGLTDIPM